MANDIEGLGESAARALMVKAANKAAEAAGYQLVRRPGRGLSAVYDATKAGKTSVLSVRTSRDRWFAFPSLQHGKAWKTLDGSDLVIVATLDNPENPKGVDVYLFPAEEVRKRFDKAYAARTKAGKVVKNDYGMWVMLDKGDDKNPNQVGHSLGVDYPAIGKFTLEELRAEFDTLADDVEEEEVEQAAPVAEPAVQLNTVAEVLAFARDRIAALTGMSPETIKLDIKMGV